VDSSEPCCTSSRAWSVHG